MCRQVLSVTSCWEKLILVTCISSLLNMIVKEAGYVARWRRRGTNYVVGGEDMSDVVLSFREGLLSVHPNSHIENSKLV